VSTASAATAELVKTNWRDEWFEFEGATYLNVAANAPMPKVAVRATLAAIEWKKFPNLMPDSAYFGLANRIRESIGKLINARPEEIAVTSGASTGVMAVAHGLEWKPGDEVITGTNEFPLQYTAWKPMEQREGLKVKIVAPSGRFVTADDYIAALTPKTRLVSVSLTRFDDGSLLDAAKLGAACHAQGTLLLLDASQCCGAVPIDVAKLGADFIVSAGYKWLLGPYGTGFFWTSTATAAKMRPGPYYWTAAKGADEFGALGLSNPEMLQGSRRWDAAETGNYFNLAALAESVDLVLRIKPETVLAHNRALIEFMFARLPKDRCVLASPAEAEKRGPYGCFAARMPEKTLEMYEKLRVEQVFVSLREGNIRVSPHLFNSERDIDKLISVVNA
jgi:cysteine desulfurase/selenocysteine lyase